MGLQLDAQAVKQAAGLATVVAEVPQLASDVEIVRVVPSDSATNVNDTAVVEVVTANVCA